MNAIPERPAGQWAPEGSHFRQDLRDMGRWAAGRIGGILSHLLGSCTRNTAGILTYHRIAYEPVGGPAPTWNVTPERFRAQIEGLLARGYHPWPLLEILEHTRRGRRLPPRTFAVTFDDGYENVYRHAWPVLRDLKVPATIFLATAYLDAVRPFPFDDWSEAGAERVSAESWRPLSTAQCRAMLADGLIELGSHTHTHSVFRGRPEALCDDVRLSLEVLRSRFGVREAAFSFPFGIAGPALAVAVRQAGVACALTTEPIPIQSRSNPFNWGRFTAAESDTPATLAARLDGWYSLARRAWMSLAKPMLTRCGTVAGSAQSSALERTR